MASRVNGPPVPGCRSEGFQAGSVFDFQYLQGTQVKAVETGLIHLENQMWKRQTGPQGEKWGRMQRYAGQIPVTSRRFVAVRIRRIEEKKD